MAPFGISLNTTRSRVRRDTADVRTRRGHVGLSGATEIAARELVRWDLTQRVVANAYHRVYYYNRDRTWQNTRWLGHDVQKLPLDLWVYQEIVSQVRPGLIVETGTWRGGTVMFLAQVLDGLGGDGRIVSVDIAAEAQPPHPRITYLDGSSTDPGLIEQIQAMQRPDEPVLVILDSDHSATHVRAELAAYADLVTPGSYLIIEDTNTGGNPIHHKAIVDGGPMVAVRELLERDPRFEVDIGCERFWVTQNPSGFLRRVR